MPNGPLDIKTFELWKDEHNAFLESQFDKICSAIAELKDQRLHGMKRCEGYREACQDEQDEKFKKTHKYTIIGIAVVAILAGAQIPAVQAAAMAIIKLIFS